MSVEDIRKSLVGKQLYWRRNCLMGTVVDIRETQMYSEVLFPSLSENIVSVVFRCADDSASDVMLPIENAEELCLKERTDLGNGESHYRLFIKDNK